MLPKQPECPVSKNKGIDEQDRAFGVVYAEVNRKKDRKIKDEDSAMVLYSEVNKRKKEKKLQEVPLVYSQVDKTKKKDKKKKDTEVKDNRETALYAAVDKTKKKHKKKNDKAPSDEPSLCSDVGKKMKNEKNKVKKGDFKLETQGKTL